MTSVSLYDDSACPAGCGHDGTCDCGCCYPGGEEMTDEDRLVLTTTMEAETGRILRLYDAYCLRNEQGRQGYRLALVTWLIDAFSLTDEEARRVFTLAGERPNRRPAPYRVTGGTS